MATETVSENARVRAGRRVLSEEEVASARMPTLGAGCYSPRAGRRLLRVEPGAHSSLVIGLLGGLIAGGVGVRPLPQPLAAVSDGRFQLSCQCGTTTSRVFVAASTRTESTERMLRHGVSDVRHQLLWRD